MTHNIGDGVTGGTQKWPVFDRNGVRVRVGDRMRGQVCIGRYGRTATIEITITKSHWTYCQSEDFGKAYDGKFHTIHAKYDYPSDTLICFYKHRDFEHGHEVWGEVIAHDTISGKPLTDGQMPCFQTIGEMGRK